MDSINVMGKNIKIVYKNCENHGEFNGDKNTITISKKLIGTKELEDTILHECLHAIFFYSGLNYIIDCEDKEEAIVRCLEYNFIPILKKIYKKNEKK